jgi:hypothetical protein
LTHDRVAVAQSIASLLRDVAEIYSADTGSKKRLVSVTPGCVHHQTTLIGTDSLSECFRTFLVDDLLPAFRAWLSEIDGGLIIVLVEGRVDDVALEL